MIYGRNSLVIENNAVRLRGGDVVAEIVPDETWPKMWRVRYRDGGLSDLANITRATDAAVAYALRVLNEKGHQETPLEIPTAA